MTVAAERIAADPVIARRSMIDSQLRVSGINEDWLIAAFARIAREDFVPAAARGHAYIDRAIPLDGGHALPAPLVQALMLQAAAPRAEDKALVVGCGSEYLATLLRPMVATLDTVSAAEAAAQASGMGQHSLILIDGAIEALPAGLAAELAEGGRIVAGLVEGSLTRLVLGRKTAGAIALQTIAEIGIPVLGEFARPKSWSF
ncbi:MAG: protein-L-isoaspartate O-methyltransferase [Novosphingobium sp.]|uniref:protein-L-isoaspartate O-methyltransferase family protein n=1 Tax=Novosphingobium sp. TaxID=1874826 RepID=UPI001D82A99B|nr:protein-L-isoaspartate O-methyltransferase [Novosphingobium sp.]MCB2058396.1 protein-L-isoaspartate O-methyltransferase [Novosphingobium sp.]MCP5387130.1 protein-L-isoaspartate O-methyltransferase [Novosphingobium sp.]